MDLYTLIYFEKRDKGICASDFENKDKIVKINLKFILSLSQLEIFVLPISGKHVDFYALLIMSNGDKYYIRQDSYRDIVDNALIEYDVCPECKKGKKIVSAYECSENCGYFEG